VLNSGTTRFTHGCIGRFEDLPTEVTLCHRLLKHIGVNVQGLLLVQAQTVHRHNLLLTNPDSTTHCLVHERLGPPRTREDNLVKVLQVETRATRLQLDKKHLLLSLHKRKLRTLEHVLLLRRREPTVILLNELHSGLGPEHVLQHVHLVVKVAEDNPLMASLRLAHQLLQHVELGRRPLPIRPGIQTLQGGLSRGNVHLRMQRQLPQAHEELELLKRLTLPTTVGLQGLPPPADDTCHTLVELALFLRVEVHRDSLVLRSRRGIGDRVAQLLHRASHHILLQKGRQCFNVARGGYLDARDFQKGHEVPDLVHNRCARKKPHALRLEQTAQLRAGVVAGETMGLIVDHARPGVALKQNRLPQRGLVPDDIDMGCEKILGAVLLVPGDVGLRNIDVHVGALQHGLPLLQDSNRSNEKSAVADFLVSILDEAGHLNGLAEAHVIAQHPARTLRLALNHPAHADDLVRLVLEVRPQRLQQLLHDG